MSKRIDQDRLNDLVREVVEGQGYELFDLELKGSGKNAVLRIFIDQPGGITHGDCKLISDQVGTVLDVEDLVPFAYTLEVSSPGLDRKLVKEADYSRFEGQKAKIQTRIPLQHQKVFKGKLRGLRDGKIQLELPKGNLMEIPLDVVQEARLEVDWAEEMARAKKESRES